MHRHRQLIAAYGAIRSIFAPQCNLTADRNGRIPTNYANPNNWMFMDRNPVQTVDLFYIYPAVSREPADSVVPIADQMKNDAKDAYLIQGSVFAEYCNLFVPYYRPVVFDDASRITDHHAWMDMLRSSVAKTDIFTAVDYYFTHLNKGRPFILAGYAEGSALVMLVLEEYMKDHPEHYRNMVAAYPIGWGVTQDWLDAYPHLKFATGKTDTGVIVSWNTVTEDVSPSAIVLGRNTRVINPLSWTTDETYADRSLNRGSLVSTGSEKTVTSRISLCDAKTGIKAGLCDARIDAERGVLVSTACPDDVASTGFPEYSLYYENLRNNGYDRITAFLGNRPLIGRPMDYSRKENWMFQATEAKHQADLFYVYPTVDMENNRVITSIGQGIEHTADGKIAVRIETTSSAVKNVNRPAKAVKETAKAAFARSGAAFESYTNVFAPYYSQIPMDRAVDYTQHTGYIDFLRKTRARTDIFAALDYYFRNLNNGRPFILAGHSQGSVMLHIILDEYMKQHPEYYKNMVAAYVIGYGTEQAWFDANPHLKFATGETDTGVVISWNAEGPDAQQCNMLIGENPKVINPLTWTTDETYADRSRNKGTLVRAADGTFSIVPGMHDARIDTARHALICTTDTKYMDDRSGVQFTKMFGDKSLHNADYKNYFANIRENGQKRIAAFLAR